MRILFVNYEYPPLGGGGGIVNAWLAQELAKRHEVTVLTSRAFDLEAHEVSEGVEIIRSRTFFRRRKAAANLPSMASFVLGGSRTCRRMTQGRSFDVINTHFAVPTGPVGARLARRLGIPNVLTVHGGDLYDPTKRSSPHRHAVLRAIVRRVVLAADAVVGQSENTNANLRRYFVPTAEPLLIPLGIPRPPAKAASREELGLAAGETVLITIGRLVARKGTDQLVRLVAMLDDPKIRLVIVGEGPDLAALRRQASNFNVSQQITFTGFVSDQRKADLLAAADIYVSTSQHEGFGLVFLEAMAQGLPIVCYDHGGQTDFLSTGVSGAVLPLNDLSAFAAAVTELVANRGERARMSARNRKDVERYYIENCARQYEELFNDVSQKRRPQPGR